MGPLEARLDGRPVALGPRKQRAVLAMLALEAGRTVSADRLVEGLWGEQPPPSAPKMVQLYVSQLRRAARRRRRGDRHPRPRLRAAAGRRRRRRGRALRAAARSEARPARGARAVARRRRWPTSPTSRSRRPRSAGSRSCGCARPSWRSTPTSRPAATPSVIGELEALVAAHPLREHLHAQRMLALYRAGRQAEALERLPRRARGARRGDRRRARRRAAAPARAILAQDPALDLARRRPSAAPRAAGPPPRRRRWLLGAAASLLLAGVSAFGGSASLGSPTGSPASTRTPSG